MLAGVWTLVFVPLVSSLQISGCAESMLVPTFLKVQAPQSFADSYITITYTYLTFCMGVVLLFSKERIRRPNRLDWTQRWGVIASYGVLLLGVSSFGFITALVWSGIAALFMSMRLVDQPAVTKLLVHFSTGYMYYWPHPSRLMEASAVGFSSIVVLLACVPLYNALRSSGSKVLAQILLAPLVLASTAQLTHVARHLLGLTPVSATKLYRFFFYFNPEGLTKGIADLVQNPRGLSFIEFISEAAKWLAIVAIALRLSIAQIASYRRPSPKDRPTASVSS